MCAVLLELKVGRLLPGPQPDTEEELLGSESPDLLYARSIELAAFRRVSERVAELLAAAALMAPREAGPPPELSHLYPDLMEKVTAAGHTTAYVCEHGRCELPTTDAAVFGKQLAKVRPY